MRVGLGDGEGVETKLFKLSSRLTAESSPFILELVDDSSDPSTLLLPMVVAGAP